MYSAYTGSVQGSLSPVVLDPFIGRIPQAWSGGDDTMGMDEGHAVTINGTTTTTVGSVEGVLGGVRHVGKRRVWDESDRDVADVSARRAHPNIPPDQIYCPPH
jgi:hypothetical protein